MGILAPKRLVYYPRHSFGNALHFCEIKRITDDASVQVDAAVSVISEGKRVDTENVYIGAISLSLIHI